MGNLPSFNLEGQVALVTASARGLGRAIALALAEAGASVALGLRDKSQDSGAVAEVQALGRPVLPLQMNMAELGQIRSAIAEAAHHFGRLDILVNNAGIAPSNMALDVVESDFYQTLLINLRGTFFACQEAAKIM